MATNIAYWPVSQTAVESARGNEPQRGGVPEHAPAPVLHISTMTPEHELPRHEAEAPPLATKRRGSSRSTFYLRPGDEIPPTAEDWEVFLTMLSAHPDEAGRKYESLRQKLLFFFSRKNADSAGQDPPDLEWLADVVIGRVAKYVGKGIPVTKSIEHLTFGVAGNVWYEWLNRPGKTVSLEDELNVGELTPATGKNLLGRLLALTHDDSPRLRCKKQCLNQLKANERELLTNYHDTPAQEKNKDRRKALAQQQGCTVEQLRVRVVRLKERVRKCVAQCCQEAAR